MNELMIPTQTMSSVVIAELTGKRHDHVMRDIKKMLDELNLGVPNFGGTYQDSQGKERPLFNLPKRECLILVSGYNVELRAKIVDRWQELEEQAKHQSVDPANLSRMQLIQLAMQAEQERLALEHQVEEMKPEVQAYARLAKADGSLCITDVAKQLQMQPRQLFGFLFANEWIYRRTGSSPWIAYQETLRQGLAEHKIDVVTGKDGTDKVVTQVRLTPKGMTKLAKMLETKGIIAA